jgi:hypothetical protein
LTCLSHLDCPLLRRFNRHFLCLVCVLWGPMFISIGQTAIIQHDWNSYRRARTAGFGLA